MAPQKVKKDVEVLAKRSDEIRKFVDIIADIAAQTNLLSLNNVEIMIINEKWIRYDIQNSVELFFHLGNDKLFRITTLDNYKGKLFEKIGVGTTEEEMLKVEPSFVYDDFEEVWESDKGVFVEMDAETNKVRWISIYIPELNLDNFEDCKW